MHGQIHPNFFNVYVYHLQIIFTYNTSLTHSNLTSLTFYNIQYSPYNGVRSNHKLIIVSDMVHMYIIYSYLKTLSVVFYKYSCLDRMDINSWKVNGDNFPYFSLMRNTVHASDRSYI